MKVTIEKSEQLKSPEVFPFIATYGDNPDTARYILVFGEGKTNDSYDAVMINDNGNYRPFSYKCEFWHKRFCKPFHGKITIECD